MSCGVRLSETKIYLGGPRDTPTLGTPATLAHLSEKGVTMFYCEKPSRKTHITSDQSKHSYRKLTSLHGFSITSLYPMKILVLNSKYLSSSLRISLRMTIHWHDVVPSKSHTMSGFGFGLMTYMIRAQFHRNSKHKYLLSVKCLP